MTDSAKPAGNPDPSSVTKRPSVVYNLEKTPLHVGDERPPSRFRRWTAGLASVLLGAWSWQSIVVWLAILILVVGAIVEVTGHGIIRAWLGRLGES